MIKLYTSELSKITGISKRTLHYYDNIGLLKPTLRTSNGYRIYSANDLLKLRRIMVLKYFGLTLNSIKNISASGDEELIALTKQLVILEKKQQKLFKATSILKETIANYKSNLPADWEEIAEEIDLSDKHNKRD